MVLRTLAEIRHPTPLQRRINRYNPVYQPLVNRRMARIKSQFRGYSSVGTTFLSPVRYDLDLARQDLLNQFHTHLGERVMMPRFGTIVWELLFDPLDERTERLIREDVERIISEDPRWGLQSITVTEGPNALTIEAVVTYRPTDEVVVLPLTFDKGTDTQ